MKLISHRGNINGPIKEKENTIDYILQAINDGFDCEIDIWKIDDYLYLGHDNPENLVDYSFLQKYNDKLWIHCKNVQALAFLKDKFNCFYHNQDMYTLTSHGYIWGNINSDIDENIIDVMPELSTKNNRSKACMGICSDYIINHICKKKIYDNNNNT
jgi:hypothetical protein